MTILALIFFVSVLFFLVIKKLFPEHYIWGEFWISVGITAFIVFIGYFAALHNKTGDTLVLSGYVTGKESNRVSCSHSYSCHCRRISCGKNCTSTVCSVCYHHAFDIDWDVYSNIGTFTINRVDWQGLKEPSRWTQVQNNEPVSRLESYTNYIKAVPNTLFKRNTDAKVPEYPLAIYDYWHINRVVVDEVSLPQEDLNALNAAISEKIKEIAKQKQVNLVMILTNKESLYAKDIQAAWLNGKKNDMILVIGTKTYPQIDWVETFGWAKNDIANVKVRDSVKDHGKIDTKLIDIALSNVVQYWERKPMKDYEYLKEEIEPSTIAYLIIGLIVGVAAIVKVIMFVKHLN